MKITGRLISTCCLYPFLLSPSREKPRRTP